MSQETQAIKYRLVGGPLDGKIIDGPIMGAYLEIMDDISYEHGPDGRYNFSDHIHKYRLPDECKPGINNCAYESTT